MSSYRVIKQEPPMRCELCGEQKETRPYGPQGERVCFECGMQDEKSARKAMGKLIFGDKD